MKINLNKYRDKQSNSKYLPVGMYDGGISNVRKFTADSGTVGLDYTFMCDGKTCKETWWLTEAAYVRILRLCDSCGLTKEQADLFDDDGRDVVGKRVSFAVIPDGEYKKVGYTWPTGRPAPEKIRQVMDGHMAPPPTDEPHVPPDDVPPLDDDDVPF